MKTVIYAANHKNKEIRRACSSGAVFIELARVIIQQGGVVFGAKFDNDWSVVHGHAETESEIFDFVGSKYVQSHIENEYSIVKKFLDMGKQVLFSGTPCQIEGLRGFLGKKYDNLFSMDFVCHGVPSPKVWEEYLKMIVGTRNVKAISFRDKTEGWRNFSLKIEFSDGNFYRETCQKDLFLKGFLQNIFLRPSCYECQFRGIARNSDITIADFWGVQDVVPNLFDDTGTSMVIIQSEKGEKVWSEIQHLFDTYVVDEKIIGDYNIAAVSSPVRTAKREKFFASGQVDFKLLKKLSRKSVKKKLKHFIKN